MGVSIDGIHEALARAREAAQGKDIRIGGGPATVRQYRRSGLIDEMHLAISPVVLGSGESLFEGINLLGMGFVATNHAATPNAMHDVLSKKS